MTHALTLEAQARWETEGCRRAIARYREAEAVQDPASLPPGQALLRACVPPLAAAIRQRQQEALQPTERSRGAPWAAALVALDPERLAVLTLAVCLRCEVPVDGDTAGTTARSTCLALASALALEVQYDRWTDAAGDEVLRAVQRRYPAMDAKAWRRVRKKLDGIEPTGWTMSERLQIGAALLDAAVTACPNYFRLETRHVGAGRTETLVILGEAARTLMDDRRARAEVASPILLPMLIPPIDWRYE